MELFLRRTHSNRDATLGVLHEVHPSSWHEQLAYTLEDEHRKTKVQGETRIPVGRYQILLRDTGGLTKKYAARFPDIHKGMLWLQDVPDFQWIYIHPGNTHDHTDGCILVGYQADMASMVIRDSAQAYRDLYVRILDALEREEVWITVADVEQQGAVDA